MSGARRRRGSSKSEDDRVSTTSEWSALLTSQAIDDDKENMGRDRTNEFKSALRALQGRAQVRPIQPGTNGVNNKINRNLDQYAEFMKIAKIIGQDLGKTYNKLEKLALLAKRRSLFDDKSVEIQELTFIIKDDISSLNQNIARLQKSARGSQRQNGKHVHSHSSGVVLGLQSKLATMSSEFKQVLQVRTENLKEQQSRQDQFSHGPVASTLPRSATTGFHAGSVLYHDEAQSSQGGQVAIDMGAADLRLRTQTQMSVQDDTDQLLQERGNAMGDIERTIVELGGIFQQLATMVKEQEEVVHRIDGNIEDAEMNVEAAHTELLKYFKSVTSNRWLMIKVFALLIFFFIVFVIFLA